MERPTTAIRIRTGRTPARLPPAGAAMLLAALSGCRSDLSQQLLERELRMQEDQIYQLQDALAEKCSRLDRVAGENTSLRRQLGVGDREPLPSGRGGPRAAAPTESLPTPRTGDPPVFVPPPIVAPSLPAPSLPAPSLPAPSLPGAAPRGAAPGAPGSIAPPALEGVPPLPSEPRFPGAAAPDRAAVVPVSAEAAEDADARPLPAVADEPGAGPRLSSEQSLAAAGRITHLVVNASRTACFDGDGDGASDGLAVVFEPRDGDERLVTAAGDVVISVFDAAPGGPPVAVWEIPAAEAAARFRRTSRNRGLHFVLRWPGPPPRGPHVRVAVSLTTFDGTRFDTDATVTADHGGPSPEP